LKSLNPEIFVAAKVGPLSGKLSASSPNGSKVAADIGGQRPKPCFCRGEHALIYHFHRIAFVHHALHHHRAVNSGHAVVSLGHFL
jgi:hypothetical protein